MYKIINKPLYLTILALAIAILTGCSRAKDIIYLEDIQPNVTINIQDPRPIKLQPGDRLQIVVHSRDQELVDMFNLASYGSGGNAANLSMSAMSSPLTCYTVDDNGTIEMPIIGTINVKGLSRMELQNMVRYKLLASKLIRDPIVNVEFVDMGFFVLGDMAPAKHEIKRDYINILEAISECGDLQLTGRRDNVMVLRTVDGQQTPYLVNLTSTYDVYSSPVYYLQQNDIIYVQPNDMKIESTSPLGSTYRTPSFWIGMFNTVLSLVLLFTHI